MRLLTGTVLTISLGAQVAWAAPATEEEAARLTEVFQTYLGNVPGAVTIAPDGESYTLVVDPDAYVDLAAGLAPDAETAEMMNAVAADAFEYRLTDMGDGKWTMKQDQAWTMNLAMDGVMAVNIGFAQLTFDGVWDESLLAFETFTSTAVDAATRTVVMGPDGSILQDDTQLTEVIEYAGQSTAGENGGIDSTVSMSAQGISQTSVLQGFGEPMAISLTADGYTSNTSVTGFRNGPMFALFAQVVEAIESGAPDPAALQEVLREILRALIPVFENVTGDVDMRNLAVSTPFGGGSVDSLVGVVDMNGLVAEGKYDARITMSGLTVDSPQIPPFITPLIPSDLTVDLRLSQFNLNGPALTLINAFDFMKPEPIDDMVMFSTIPQLLPRGVFGVDVGPSSVRSDVYDLSAEGGVTIGLTGVTQGQAQVRLDGIDTLIPALEALPPEMAQNIRPPLAMAQGMARVADDGALLWDVEINLPQAVTINGVPMPLQ